MYEAATTAPGGWAGDLYYIHHHTGFLVESVDGHEMPYGYAYGRVFAVSVDASPTAGTWFVQSALVPLTCEFTNVPPDLPDEVDIAPSPGSGVLSLRVGGASAPVPEPGSTALFLAGALAMAAKRFGLSARTAST